MPTQNIWPFLRWPILRHCIKINANQCRHKKGRQGIICLMLFSVDVPFILGNCAKCFPRSIFSSSSEQGTIALFLSVTILQDIYGPLNCSSQLDHTVCQVRAVACKGCGGWFVVYVKYHFFSFQFDYLQQHGISHIVCIRHPIEANLIKPNFPNHFR